MATMASLIGDPKGTSPLLRQEAYEVAKSNQNSRSSLSWSLTVDEGHDQRYQAMALVAEI
ncbi:hypothetical protein C1H46_005079 [Malus baccata]|uniref:Uncharacterized protein n=1 Tax=Malus baccata TaxID=106549 RepID=A0A540NFG0_MALBA|nr:hypothetical protein C1H46_005079 [Malus baccata]